jgi:hypothetical protein
MTLKIVYGFIIYSDHHLFNGSTEGDTIAEAAKFLPCPLHLTNVGRQNVEIASAISSQNSDVGLKLLHEFNQGHLKDNYYTCYLDNDFLKL